MKGTNKDEYIIFDTFNNTNNSKNNEPKLEMKLKKFMFN